MRRSQANANSRPPPRATPSIAAMVGMGIDAARALQEVIRRQDSHRALFCQNNCSLFTQHVLCLTDLSHEGSQAMNKQIRLSVVHQSPLFQVCTCEDYTASHMPFRKALITNPEARQVSDALEDTYLHRKHLALNS